MPVSDRHARWVREKISSTPYTRRGSQAPKSETRYVFVMVRDNMVIPGNQKPRPYPDHMYVDVPTLIKSSGGIVFLIVAFSLVMTWLTHFSMIQPEIAILIAIGAATFFLMGLMMQRRGAHNVSRSSTDH
jgi:hypothetical protein